MLNLPAWYGWSLLRGTPGTRTSNAAENCGGSGVHLKRVSGFLAAALLLHAGTLVAQTPIRVDVKVEVDQVLRDATPGASMPYLELHTAFHQGENCLQIPSFAGGGFGFSLVSAARGRDYPGVGFDVSRAEGVRHYSIVEDKVVYSGDIPLAGAVLPPAWSTKQDGLPFSLTTCGTDTSRGWLWYRFGGVEVSDPGGPVIKGVNRYSPGGREPYLPHTDKEANARWAKICNDQSYKPNDYALGYIVGGFSWADLAAGKTINLENEYEVVAQKSEGWKVHARVEATIAPADDVILLVHAPGYDAWLPVPGADENSAGPQPLGVSFELIGVGGKPPLRKVVRFELELQKTSREPGIALNAPLAPAAVSGPDLRIVAPGVAPDGEGQTAAIPSPDGRTGSARIAAYDGGGWSTLVVTAVLDRGTRVTGHLEQPDGPSEILLPKRQSGAKIASSWLAAHGRPAEDADDETTPGNPNAGDGLSAYEEYRGVVAKGAHTRLDPRRKELLIGVEAGFSARAQKGLDLFEQAAKVKVVALAPGELAQDRVVNRNAGSAHLLAQHAERLEQGSLAAGLAGENQPVETKGKTPKDSQRVVIDIPQLEGHVRAQAAAAVAAGEKLPYTAEEYLAATIAHEIAHGVGIDHHGGSSEQVKLRTVEPQQTSIKIYDAKGQEITARPYDLAGIGEQQGDASGDSGCLMAYTDAYLWAFAKEGDRYIYRKVPFLPPGTHLCTSTSGKGINAASPGPSYFGDTKTGNCAARLRVRD